MRPPQVARFASLDFNMTPMIDVTFLLIIFFLLSSHLAQQEIQLELDLPSASSGRPLEEEEHVRRLVINLTQEGAIMLGSQPMDTAELARRVDYEQQEHRRENRPLEVRIRCDRRVPYRFVEPVLLACSASGVWNVSFSVLERSGTP